MKHGDVQCGMGASGNLYKCIHCYKAPETDIKIMQETAQCPHRRNQEGLATKERKLNSPPTW